MVATWGDIDWRPIECQVRGMDWQEGADRALGMLSAAAAGSWTCELYDPTRDLDPSNPEALWGRSVAPGQHIRFGFTGTPSGTIGTGIIDAVSYEVATGLARLRGTDAVGELAQTDIVHPIFTAWGTWVWPIHLHEYVRLAISRAPSAEVTVEAEPATGSPQIGIPFDMPEENSHAKAWETIAEAARDALQMAWVDRDRVVRFAPFDDPPDAGLIIGCEGVPLISLGVGSSADGIVNQLWLRDNLHAERMFEASSSASRYGPREYDRRERVIEGAEAWATAVLTDRAFASLNLLPLQAWPSDTAQLDAFMSAPYPSVIRIRADAVDPPVEMDGRMVARGVTVDPDGWGLTVMAYVSATEWEGSVTEPGADATGTPVLRVSEPDKVAWLQKTSAGTRQGAGASVSAAVGYQSGARHRMLVRGPIDFTGAVGVQSAVLRLTVSPEVHVTWGGQPRVRAKRIVDDWTEGSSATSDTGNAVKWPGPDATSTGESGATVPRTSGATVDIDITRIVRAWAPRSAGGSGKRNLGIRIVSWDESDHSRTTEFRTDEGGAGARPEFRVTVLT